MATRLWGMENREIGVRFPRAANVFLFSNWLTVSLDAHLLSNTYSWLFPNA
jgi:hypothetical protein